MKYQVYPASERAKAKIDPSRKPEWAAPVQNKHHKVKYPIDLLEVGECFTVPFGEASEASLRQTATKRGKMSNKLFCVLKHDEHNCFEVARVG